MLNAGRPNNENEPRTLERSRSPTGVCCTAMNTTGAAPAHRMERTQRQLSDARTCNTRGERQAQGRERACGRRALHQDHRSAAPGLLLQKHRRRRLLRLLHGLLHRLHLHVHLLRRRASKLRLISTRNDTEQRQGAW